MMEPLDQLREWGYRVEQAMEVGGVPVWFIEGFGLSTYVRADDEGAISAIADIDAHVERELQQDETTEETSLRWHEDPSIDYQLGAEREKEVRASIDAMKQAQQPEEE